MYLKRLSALLLLLPIALSGCLKARETDRILYDPVRDEFRAVMVLENIEGGTGDMDYLAKLVANKDHLLAPCMPGNAFGYAPWFLRLDEHQAAKVHFVEPKPGDMAPIKLTESLGDIVIRPGTFFVQNNRLSYYHQLVIPGKAADALIAETRKTQLKQLKKMVQEEADRRKSGGKIRTWAELIAQEVAAVKNNSTDHPIKPFMVMDQKSIDDLVTLTADPKQGLVRKGGNFTLTLPLTPRDVAGMTALWEAWRKSAEETAAKSEKKDDPMLAMQRLPAQAMSVATSDKGLVLSIDTVKLYNSFAETFQKFADSRDTPPGAAKEPTSEVRYAQDRHWITGETFTTARLLADFNANTLRSYPTPTPVKPGEGLKVIPK